MIKTEFVFFVLKFCGNILASINISNITTDKLNFNGFVTAHHEGFRLFKESTKCFLFYKAAYTMVFGAARNHFSPQ